jgi:cytochrome oxidase assembly protein ShyY1
MTGYRKLLAPRWLLIHALVVVLVGVMANLSLWQFQRLDERKEFNQQVRANAAQPPVGLAELIELPIGDIEWRKVIVSGTFRPADEVIVLNRSQDGTAGYDPLTPLDTTVGTDAYVVLVDRGFVPLATDTPPPPTGQIEFLGRVRLSQERRLGALTDPAEGVLDEVQRIDVERLSGQMATASSQEVLPFYVDLLESPAITSNLPARVADPELSNGSHLSYAIQWIIFSLCAVVAWVFLVRKALRPAQPSSAQE